MNPTFSLIKVLIWDLDGTLYPKRDDLWGAIREGEYQVIMQHTGWTREKTVEEFSKIYKIKTPSGTKAAALLSNISTQQAADECEWYFDRRKYLKRDEQLVALFASLKSYTHFVLTNGVIQKTKETLIALGIDISQIAEVVTSETVGENKPSIKGFTYIIEKSGLPPEQHLMIGDRIPVDLAPAKSVGMKTCLVWSEPLRDDTVDISLSTVYELSSILL